MKIIFKDLNKEISDALIWDLARNFCLPAFYEFALRARNKSSAGTKLIKLHKYLVDNGYDLPSLAQIRVQPIKNLKIKASELTMIHPNVYDAPVRSLVSVFNSNKINKFIVQERVALKVGHIVKDINRNNLRFTNYESQLTNREMHAIKTSFLYLNWFLVNRTYKRPNVNIVRYLCSNDLLNVYLESGISGFISKIDAKKNHHFLRLN